MRFIRSLLAFSALMFSSHAWAHTVWLEPVAGKVDVYRVVFGGHLGKEEKYRPEKLKSVEAIDAQGARLDIRREVMADGVNLQISGPAALIAAHFDNGIHTRGPNGPSVEKPMSEVRGAKSATNAVKYHKTIVAWSALVSKPLNQPFEVVPVDAAKPVAGKTMRVQVLLDGKPAAGIRLGRGEEGKPNDPVTDASGVASFTPEKGFNKLWAGKRTATTGNPNYTELSYEYLLGFNAD